MRHWLLFVVCAIAAGCPKKSREVTVYTSVDQVFAEPLFKKYEETSHVTVHAVYDTEETKSTGVLNRIVAEAARPQCDVFFSGDPVRPQVLVKKGLVEPYFSPNASDVPPAFKTGAFTPSAARARVLLVNTTKLAKGSDFPSSIKDLANPKYKGQAAMANPLFGTTTMHVAALFAVWGDAATKAFLEEVTKNGTKIASSNGDVKRLVSTGEVAFGLTDTDDANEAINDKAPVAVVFPDQEGVGTLVMPTAIVKIKGGPHPDEAGKLVDWLAGAEVEKALAESAAHLPLRAGVPGPRGTRPLKDIRAMTVDYAKVADQMEAMTPWLRSWAGM